MCLLIFLFFWFWCVVLFWWHGDAHARLVSQFLDLDGTRNIRASGVFVDRRVQFWITTMMSTMIVHWNMVFGYIRFLIHDIIFPINLITTCFICSFVNSRHGLRTDSGPQGWKKWSSQPDRLWIMWWNLSPRLRYEKNAYVFFQESRTIWG